MPSLASQGELVELARALRAWVEYERELGVVGYPAAPAAPSGAVPGTAASPVPAPAPSRVAAPTLDLFAEPGVAQAGTLEELRAAIGDCQRCKLARHRTHLVFGVGNPHARLVFVGEGPGHDEDLQGEPFARRPV